MNEPSIHGMSVCAGSGGVFGPLAYGTGVTPIHAQHCRWTKCPYIGERWHDARTELPEPPGDFPEAIELCYACASATIPSGHKFACFFCDECKAFIDVLRRAGITRIPLGRHSIMNGIALRGSPVPGPANITAFLEDSKRLFHGIDRLFEWRRILVGDHIAAAYPDAPYLPLSQYLSLVRAHALPKRVLFEQVCRYFGVDPGALTA